MRRSSEHHCSEGGLAPSINHRLSFIDSSLFTISIDLNLDPVHSSTYALTQKVDNSHDENTDTDTAPAHARPIARD
ncbi:hypothetical protein D9619_012440 [Psilocybe cf. subviscida]|uniref:Uncharacterized protein n=1 Tax=Psilocybe cf. subviscida TaxID=2480587 RepID=A0A8H5AS07_9AGAR|nr:hypothetical protein D9619_012440 [Psilocybe cf. subviscida]